METKAKRNGVSDGREQLRGLKVCSLGFEFISSTNHLAVKEPDSKQLFPADDTICTSQEYQLIYITEGKGEIWSSINGTSPVYAGLFIILHPNEQFVYQPDVQTGWKQYWICFKANATNDQLPDRLFGEDKHYFYTDINPEVISVFRKAVNLVQREEAYCDQMLIGITIYLVGLIFSLDEKASADDADFLMQIDRACDLMKERVGSTLSFRQLAEEVGLDDVAFYKHFEEITGFSPEQYFQNLKLQRAKDLLCATSLSVAEIASMLGFKTPDSFSAQFKKKTGQYPGEFREIV